MDDNQKPSKKELKQLRRLEGLEKEKQEKKNSLVKWLLIGISSFLFLGVFIFVIIQNKQNSDTKQVSVEVSQNDWIRGDKNAKVTLIEFSDFECPACKAYTPYTEQLINDYKGKVRLVYKEFPLTSIHKNALPAAKAAEAAGAQNKFWQMHDLLFDKQDEWAGVLPPIELFKKYAASLSLDLDKFQKDMNSSQVSEKIIRDMNEGNKIGLTGTPTFVLEGKMIQLPGNYEELKQIVEQEVSKK
ncbi:MAG: hypothetical protein A2905_04250 [Candidatus Levybacteria bacterium RIFCSPLOWO2_01_FULL_36_10]|nr:MAG: hypothetical protein A2905_04250 [Candidatus Levybacteria bacterium RIFCSPLOWO2_01_FULL_36_10]